MLHVSAAAFDALSPGVVYSVADHLREENESFVHRESSDDANAQPTSIYRTREGGVGLIQITTMTDDPPSVSFRWKPVISSTQPTARK